MADWCRTISPNRMRSLSTDGLCAHGGGAACGDVSVRAPSIDEENVEIDRGDISRFRPAGPEAQGTALTGPARRGGTPRRATSFHAREDGAHSPGHGRQGLGGRHPAELLAGIQQILRDPTAGLRAAEPVAHRREGGESSALVGRDAACVGRRGVDPGTGRSHGSKSGRG